MKSNQILAKSLHAKRKAAFTALDVIAFIALPTFSALIVIALASRTPADHSQRDATAIGVLNPPATVNATAADPSAPGSPETMRAPAGENQYRAASYNYTAPSSSADPRPSTYVWNGVTVVTPNLQVPYVELNCDQSGNEQQSMQASSNNSAQSPEARSVNRAHRASHRSRVASRARPPHIAYEARRILSAILR